MERRTFLAGGAAAVAGLVTQPAASHYYDIAWVKSPPGLPLAPSDLEAAVARLRKQFLAEFDAAYVENVIVPHFLVSIYEGEKLFLPMIDVEFTKENALPFDLWGLLSETWKPAPEYGVTVFLQGLETVPITPQADHMTRSRRTVPPMWRQSHKIFRQALASNARQAAYGPILRAISISTGTCISASKAMRSRTGSGRSGKASTPCLPIAIPPRKSSTRTI